MDRCRHSAIASGPQSPREASAGQHAAPVARSPENGDDPAPGPALDRAGTATIPRGLSLGPIALDFPMAQAALSGYSDWPMRVLARRMGAPYTLCEVILDQFILTVKRAKIAREYLMVSDEEHPCGVQLMGADPEQFSAAAAKVVQCGFDAVDINFGCPVKKVLGRCRGGFLLSTPEVALEIVARVRDAVPPHIPVTLKMRRGLDDSHQSRDHFYTIFDGAFARGVAAIAVHGRTVRQRYEGESNWDFLAEVKRHAGSRVVLGSGDLFTAHDVVRRLSQSGLDGAMIARGAIGNPWIFREIRELAAGRPLPPPPTLAEQRAVMEEHYRLAEELYGPEGCCGPMSKFGIKYAQRHPQAVAVRDDFVKARTRQAWTAVLDRWYAEA